MNLFARAHANLNLTPAERSILKLLELCLVAGLVSALPIVAQALGQQPLDWSTMLHTAIAAFSVAFLGALVKWLKAQTDAPLPDAAPSPAVQVPPIMPPQGRWNYPNTLPPVGSGG